MKKIFTYYLYFALAFFPFCLVYAIASKYFDLKDNAVLFILKIAFLFFSFKLADKFAKKYVAKKTA